MEKIPLHVRPSSQFPNDRLSSNMALLHAISGTRSTLTAAVTVRDLNPIPLSISAAMKTHYASGATELHYLVIIAINRINQKSFIRPQI